MKCVQIKVFQISLYSIIMRFFRYKGRNRRVKRVGKRKSVRFAGKRSSSIARIAKKVATKVIRRQIETKQGYLEPTGAGFNTQTSQNFPVLPNITQTSMYQLCPTVSLGTDSQSRVGNKIKPKGLYVKGHIYGDWNNIVGNNSSFQTIYVRIMAISDKQNNVDSLAYGQFGTSSSILLNKGSTSTNFLFNDQTSLYRPINTNRFTVYYDKVIKLSMYSANLGTALIDQATGLRRFSFKIPMKEDWKFDDSNSRPSNIAMPNLVVGYCPADNRNITAGATTSFIKLTYYTDFYYQDV